MDFVRNMAGVKSAPNDFPNDAHEVQAAPSAHGLDAPSTCASPASDERRADAVVSPVDERKAKAAEKEGVRLEKERKREEERVRKHEEKERKAAERKQERALEKAEKERKAEERKEERERKKAEDLKRKEAEKNKPSLAAVFADQLITDRLTLRGCSGPWCAMAEHTAGGEVVYRWNGIYWQHVGGGDGVAMAAEWLRQHAPDKASAKVAEGLWLYACMQLRRRCPFPRTKVPYAIVPCADVYLVLKKDGSMVAAKPDPSMGVTYAVQVRAGVKPGEPYKPAPLPPTSKFRAWLDAAQPNRAVQAVLQEQCGMTLLPEVYSMAAWWYGAAGSGKSMLAELMEAMQRQTARAQLEQLANFRLEGLLNASLIIVEEVEGERWNEATFKTLVSGNGLPVDRKFEKGLVSYHSTAKWIITSNPAPFVRDKSDGVWRRLCVIYFAAVMPEEQRVNHYHLHLLETEGRAILDWMLEGARRIVQRGRFLPRNEWPEAVKEWNFEARAKADSVLAWVTEENVRVDRQNYRSLDEIYKSYLDTCEAAHREPLTGPQFWRAIYANGKLCSPKDISNRRTPKGQKRYAPLAWGPLPVPTEPEKPSVSTLVPLATSKAPGMDFCDDSNAVWLVPAVGGPELEFPTEELAIAEIAKRQRMNGMHAGHGQG